MTVVVSDFATNRPHADEEIKVASRRAARKAQYRSIEQPRGGPQLQGLPFPARFPFPRRVGPDPGTVYSWSARKSHHHRPKNTLWWACACYAILSHPTVS